MVSRRTRKGGFYAHQKGWFLGAPERMVSRRTERMKTTQVIKRHSMQLRLKSDNLKEAMSQNWHVTHKMVKKGYLP